MLLPASPSDKVLFLGTALWGWGTDRATAHRILDIFVAHGGRVVDTATNYPINRQHESFGLASRWIAEWMAANGNVALSVLAKFGATDNSGGANARLDPPFIRESENLLRQRFGPALAAMAIHWDNRGDVERDAEAIAETVAEMTRLQSGGLSIGFSGVRHPHLYQAAAPGLAGKWWIQVKENIVTDAARRHYEKAFPAATYLAYGINMGGAKLAPSAADSSMTIRGLSRPEHLIGQLAKFLESQHGLRPAPVTLNELALAYCYQNRALSGVIIGPRNAEQLVETLRFWSRLKSESSPAMATTISDLARHLR